MNIVSVILKWGKDAPLLFFPEYPANPGRIVCYAHAGQHGEADMGYYCWLKNPRTLEQKRAAHELFREYQRNNPEYTMRIINRDRSKFRKIRWNKPKRAA